MTIRTRLTLWYGLTLIALLAIAGAVVGWMVEARLHETLDQELQVRAADVVANLDDLPEQVNVMEPVARGIFTVVIDPSTGATTTSPGAPADIPTLPVGSSQRRLTADGPDYAFYSTVLPEGQVLVTGSSLASIQRFAALIPEVLITVGGVLALVALAGGWWLAGRALGPIRELTAEADAIGPDDLARRLPTFRQQDEVGHLAATLNRLLGRVETAVQHERAFIAGAAHDLRTPIATLRTRLEALTEDRRDGTDTRASIEDATRDVVRLGELADELLALAEAQAQGPADAVDPQVLPLLVLQAEQEVEWLAHERGIRFEQSIDEVTVRISGVRFHQALANLLSNAVRHGPEGGTISLSVHVEPVTDGRPERNGSTRPPVETLYVEVADEGPGIDAADRDDLFVPFGLQRRGSQSHGLGLATAAAAVRSQGGQIGYRDGDTCGAVFWFRLPIRQPEFRA
jgi:signal transduction histidine kinase